MNLSGHSAIITGGASGLGGATAEALHNAGVKVALWDLNEDKGEAHAAKLGGVFCKVDVADEDSVQAAITKTISEISAPRILVNCAGIAIGQKVTGNKDRQNPDGPRIVHTLNAFRKVIDVNLIGTFNCIRLFAEEVEKLDGHHQHRFRRCL